MDNAEPGSRTVNPVVEHLRDDNDRLRAELASERLRREQLLAAERNENRRLWRAFAEVKEGLGLALGTLQCAHAESENERYVECAALKATLDRLHATIEAADDTVEPLVGTAG